MIFDINMNDNFTCKSKLVTGSHTTYPQASSTYSMGVSIYSVHISFMLAVKNCVDVYAVDIGNTYLNVPCRGKLDYKWSRVW